MIGDDSIGAAERLGVALGLFPEVVAGVEDVDARSEADMRERMFGAAERWGLASTSFTKATPAMEQPRCALQQTHRKLDRCMGWHRAVD